MAKKTKKMFKGSQQKLSAKVSKVRRDDPSLTEKQAVGKAAGILAGEEKQKRRKK